MFSSSQLKPAQKEKIAKFAQVTGASDKTAKTYLTAASWNLELAVDSFFLSGGDANAGSARPSSTVNAAELTNLFNKYKEADEDLIGLDGVEKICEDLEVDPSDTAMLVISYHLGAQKMAEYTRDGWMKGWTKLRCDSLDKMKSALPGLRDELEDDSKFREIYQFTFNFMRTSDGQKSIPPEVAVAYWELLLAPKYPLVEEWIDFVNNKNKKAISRDTWNLLLDFLKTTEPDLSNYDSDGAWPSTIDAFVDWKRKKMESES